MLWKAKWKKAEIKDSSFVWVSHSNIFSKGKKKNLKSLGPFHSFAPRNIFFAFTIKPWARIQTVSSPCRNSFPSVAQSFCSHEKLAWKKKPSGLHTICSTFRGFHMTLHSNIGNLEGGASSAHVLWVRTALNSSSAETKPIANKHIMNVCTDARFRTDPREGGEEVSATVWCSLFWIYKGTILTWAEQASQVDVLYPAWSKGIYFTPCHVPVSPITLSIGPCNASWTRGLGLRSGLCGWPDQAGTNLPCPGS